MAAVAAVAAVADVADVAAVADMADMADVAAVLSWYTLLQIDVYCHERFCFVCFSVNLLSYWLYYFRSEQQGFPTQAALADTNAVTN